MKKFFKYNLVLIFIVLILFACNKKDNDEEILETIVEETRDPKEVLLEQKKATYDINNLANIIDSVKLVSEYDNDTLVDDMDSVLYGKYFQYENNDKDKDYIEWIVLERKDNLALLMSKYILDNKSYNTAYTEVAWDLCKLRKFLNNDFYNEAFDDNEKAYILSSRVFKQNNERFGISGGTDTTDRIFIPSAFEMEIYFGQENMLDENKKAATYGTPYAKTVDNQGQKLWYLENYPNWYNGNSSYFLRTPGITKTETSVVNHYGYLNTYGVQIVSKNIGVRPCMWIKYK